MFDRLRDQDMEDILSGRVPAGRPALADLAGLVVEIRDSSVERVSGAVVANHVGAAAAVARAAGEVPFPSEAAPGGVRRRLVGALSGATAKVMLWVVVALVATAGAAVAGILPPPIQSAVADAAGTVGINLPRPSTAPSSETDDMATTTSPTTTTTTTTSTAPAPAFADDDVDEAEDETRTPPPSLVGTHTWQGTHCSGEPARVDYEVTSSGTLRLLSVSDPDAERRVLDDRIEVDFADGVSVRIDLDRSGDEWEVRIGEDRDCDVDEAEDEETRTPPPSLVGTHTWQGTHCSGAPARVDYEVTSSGTLRLLSVSDPDADTEVRSDRIEVEFADGVSVRIDLDRSGDEWEVRVGEDRDCD